MTSFSRIVQRSIIIYKKPDSWKKRNSFFTCRSDVISQTIFFTHTHTRKKHDKISQRFICFPTFISKMGGIVTFLCKRLDCAARVHLENATYVNNSFTKYLTVYPFNFRDSNSPLGLQYMLLYISQENLSLYKKRILWPLHLPIPITFLLDNILHVTRRPCILLLKWFTGANCLTIHIYYFFPVFVNYSYIN